MQTKWDDLDNIFADAYDNIEVDKNYNDRLMDKLHHKSPFMNQRRIAAFSLITAGFLIIFMCTSSFQYRFIELKFKLKSQAIALQYQYSDRLNVVKYIFRSDKIETQK